jgi:cytoskeleton protein RodZ
MTEQVDLITMGLGEQLRIARETQGIEVLAAAVATRLSENTIRIIENEQWEQLPGVYRAGWARNYAAYLGVELEPHESEIRNLSAEGIPELQSVFSEGIKINKMDTNLRVLSYAVMSIFVVLPLIWAYTKTAANLSQPDVIAVAKPVAGKNASGKSLTIPRQAGRDNSGTGIPQHMEANVVPLKSLNGQDQAAAGAADNRNIDSVGNTGNSAGNPDHQLLEVRLKADSWVVVTDAAGTRLEYDLLRGGSSYSYSGIAPFDVLIGRASAVELSINGRPVDLGEYESGNVASLELDVIAED